MLQSVVNFLTSVDVARLATHPAALTFAGIVFVLAVLFRWKFVLVVLLAVGGTLAVLRYSRIAEGGVGFEPDIAIFAVGSVLLGIVLIYFLFISGD